jgi:iron complex transport system substrate-binding protein
MIAQLAILVATARIVSLSPATTEDLFELGAAPQVVGIDQFAERPAQIKGYPRFGGTYSANAELVMAAEPSLVIYQRPDTPAIAALRRTNLDVVGLPGQTLRDDWTTIETVGKLTGRELQAHALVRRLRGHIADRARGLSRQRRLRVLLTLGDFPVFSVASGSFPDDLLRLANLENVAENAGTPWPQLSPEFVAESNPDVIIVADDQGILLSPQRPPWDFMDAAKARRIVHIREDLDCGPYIDRLFDAIVDAVAPYRR